jgi:hypothetical protein
MFSGSTTELEVPVECPCGEPLKIKARSAKPGTKLTCPSCKTQIVLKGDDLREAQRAMDDLMRTLGKLGRIGR